MKDLFVIKGLGKNGRPYLALVAETDTRLVYLTFDFYKIRAILGDRVTVKELNSAPVGFHWGCF